MSLPAARRGETARALPPARAERPANALLVQEPPKRLLQYADTRGMPNATDLAGADAFFQPQQLVCSQFVITDARHGVLTARVVGPHIGQREAQVIARELNAAVAAADSEFHTLVMDMKSVRAMSSLGLGMCIDVRNTAHARGARIIMMSLCRELFELFCMMKVDRLFTLAHDKAELKKLLRR